MWRFLRKRRALRAYRTILFKHLRQTYGRKLYYSPDEVRDGAAYLRVNTEFLCYALGMFCDQVAFDAFHAVTGEVCDYGVMRAEVFAHVADVPVIDGAQFDAGCTHHSGTHDTDSGSHDVGVHHDAGGHDWAGFDNGGCDVGGHHSSD